MIDESAEYRRLLEVMELHQGVNAPIKMVDLNYQVYGVWPEDKINGTRRLRNLIKHAQETGIPIASSADAEAGGYYLATGPELRKYCQRLRARALRVLGLEAKLRNRALPVLVGQIVMEMWPKKKRKKKRTVWSGRYRQRTIGEALEDVQNG